MDGSGSSGKGEERSKRLLGAVGVDDVKDIKELIRYWLQKKLGHIGTTSEVPFTHLLFTKPPFNQSIFTQTILAQLAKWGPFTDIIFTPFSPVPPRWAVQNFTWVDESRLGVMGTNYGGYLALLTNR